MKFCSRERKFSFPFRVSGGFELSEFELSGLYLQALSARIHFIHLF